MVRFPSTPENVYLTLLCSVWFQHYRKENFHDESLPPGKWTKRESKQNWVRGLNSLDPYTLNPPFQSAIYAQQIINRSPPLGPLRLPRSTSGHSTPASGQQTPREIREERWRLEADLEKPGKIEMREMYKELGGRKAKTKPKWGSAGTMRDKGGWANGEDE